MDLISCADCKKTFNKSFGDSVNCKNYCHSWICYDCVSNDDCLRNHDVINETLQCPKCLFKDKIEILVEELKEEMDKLFFKKRISSKLHDTFLNLLNRIIYSSE